MDESVKADRARLVATNQFAAIIDAFVADGSKQELEIVFAAGMELPTGVKFVSVPGITAETMYQRVYTAAYRGKWLKRDVWVKKKGNSVWLYKYDPNKKRG